MRSANVVFNSTAWRFETDALPAVRFRHIIGAQLFLHKRLLISSSSRKCFSYGATAETAKVYRMLSKNEQLANKDMVFMPQDQTSNTLRKRGYCAAVSAHGRLTERPGTAAKSVASRSALVTSGADLLLGKKGLSLGPLGFGGPNILGVRTISSIFVSNYIYIFLLVQRTFFTMQLTKDLCRTGVPKLCLTMHPISISTDEHLTLKFL